MTVNKFDWNAFYKAIIVTSVLSLGALLIHNGCNNQAPQIHTGYKYDSTEKTTITHFGDTIPSKISATAVDTLYLPKWLSKHTHDTILQAVDTNAIINMFLNNAYRYEQTIRDSDMLIQIEDTIYRNTPVWRKVTAKNLRATRFDTTVYTTPNTWHIFAGGEVSINTPTPQLRLGGIFQTKKGTQYSLHYDVLQPKPNIQFGTHFKLK